MPQINKVIVTTTYTRPNTSFAWHENGVTDPYLNNIQQEVFAIRWADYVNLKTVERKNPDELTFVIRFTWLKEATYNEYKSMPIVQEYEPLLKAYYENNGGSLTETVEVVVNDFLST